MPKMKMKSHSGAKKRFKITANGHVKHKQAGVSHILSGKRHKTKRQLRGTAIVSHAQERQVKRVLPYGA